MFEKQKEGNNEVVVFERFIRTSKKHIRHYFCNRVFVTLAPKHVCAIWRTTGSLTDVPAME